MPFSSIRAMMVMATFVPTQGGSIFGDLTLLDRSNKDHFAPRADPANTGMATIK